MHRNSFEKFYFERIAVGEACGCAEAVARFRDIDAAAENHSASMNTTRRAGVMAGLRRLLGLKKVGQD